MTAPLEDYRLIPLTKGQFAKISPHRAEEIREFKWHAVWNPCTHSFYAVRGHERSIGDPTILMHRQIFGMVPGDGKRCDHRDRDTLNNQDHNLREATTSQNGGNMGLSSRNSSGYKGVNLDKASGLWLARIGHKRKQYNLGRFSTPEKAFAAYCGAAERLFGEFKCLG